MVSAFPVQSTGLWDVPERDGSPHGFRNIRALAIDLLSLDPLPG